MIYQTFKTTLIESFETERDIMVIRQSHNRLESLFGIATETDRLYENIIRAFERIAVRNVERLVCELCRRKNIFCAFNESRESFDIEIEINGENKFVEFKSQPNTMSTSAINRFSEEVRNASKPVIMVFLLKDGRETREAVSRFLYTVTKQKQTPLECMLFEEFLEAAFGGDEKRAFQEAMVHFKEEMRQAVGYQVTEVCSPYNLQKLKTELDHEILNFQYDAIKAERYEQLLMTMPNAHDLNTHYYTMIKNEFLQNNKYLLLLGDSDFAESYLTSEWLYKKYFTLDELDNTFIVSGYLKSIEQLLWDIIFIVGQGREIRGIMISESTEDEIDKTLGALQYFLGNWENDDLFLNSFGNSKHFVMNYVKTQISDWRKQYRNGYFHKHNLNDKNKIEAIREETYFLYMLILGSLKLSPIEMDRLNS
jgi:hypothetical protein